MKNINTYIFEKLVIDKDTKLPDGKYDYTVICSLCSVKTGNPDDERYVDTIKSWCRDNKIRFKNLKLYVRSRSELSTYLKHQNISNTGVVSYFEENANIVNEYCTDLIVNRNGDEVMGKKFPGPIVYFNKEALIFHGYDDDTHKNIDRLFLNH